MSFWKKFLGFDPNEKRMFPGQQLGEDVELMTVFHGITLIPFFIYLLILAGGIISLNFFVNFSLEIILIINTISFAILIHIFCWRIYNHFLKVIIITNHRLIFINYTVLLRKEREAIPMMNIQEFKFIQQGFLPRIFGYGDLIVLGSSTDIKYLFKYVPKVNKIHHLLCEVHQKVNQVPDSK